MNTETKDERQLMAGKVYISGRIVGLPEAEVRAKFARAQTALLRRGYGETEIVSPLACGLLTRISWELHIALNMVLLIPCEAIYLLEDWDTSRECMIEKNFSELTGKTLLYETAPTHPEIKEAITAVLGVSFADVTGSSKEVRLVYARKIFAFYASMRGTSACQIGKLLHRHRGTVKYYLNTYRDEYAYGPKFRKLADEVGEYLTGFYGEKFYESHEDRQHNRD